MKYRSNRRGANERPTPLARKRMENAALKILRDVYERGLDRKEQENGGSHARITVAKPGQRTLSSSSPNQNGEKVSRIKDSQTRQGNKKIRVYSEIEKKYILFDQNFGKKSKKKRPILSEYDGPTKFSGGRMIVQGGLPELGKNSRH